MIALGWILCLVGASSTPGCSGAIEGVVRTQEGLPLHGFDVGLRSTTRNGRGAFNHRGAYERVVQTDYEGTFSMTAVPPGAWEVVLLPDSTDGFLAGPSPVHVDDEVSHVLIEARRGWELSGRLDLEAGDIDDTIVQDCAVYAHDLATGEFYSSSAFERKGRFVLGPFLGDVVVEAHYYGLLPIAHSARRTVSAAEPTVGLVLPRGTHLRGEVRDDQDRLKLACVRLVEETPGGGLVYHGDRLVPLWGGRFTTGALKDGVYTLIATTPDGRVGCLQGLEVIAGMPIEALTVSVRSGTTVQIRADSKHGSSVSFWMEGEPVGFAFGGQGKILLPHGRIAYIADVGGERVSGRFMNSPGRASVVRVAKCDLR